MNFYPGLRKVPKVKKSTMQLNNQNQGKTVMKNDVQDVCDGEDTEVDDEVYHKNSTLKCIRAAINQYKRCRHYNKSSCYPGQ